MKNSVTIIMYHYVRDFAHSLFPDIKGLDVRAFVGQLAYLKKHYHFISVDELVAAVNQEIDIPGNSVLLTFDDGYSDHFRYVFPLLDELKVQGAFYPTVRAVEEHTLLDINKIHYILAAVKDKSLILTEITRRMDLIRDEYGLESNDAYLARIDRKQRYDSEEVVLIKRLLQSVLPEKVRQKIAADLFALFVSSDEAAFAEQLYMTPAQMACMARHGMHFGVHGYDHYRLDGMDEAAQEREITSGLSFLKRHGIDIGNWTMCYPHGSADDKLLCLLKKHACKLGLTIEPDRAELRTRNPLLLPRLDTNDLPRSADAPMNDWTRKILEDNLPKQG